jgi:hypothetical protein
LLYPSAEEGHLLEMLEKDCSTILAAAQGTARERKETGDLELSGRDVLQGTIRVYERLMLTAERIWG